MSELAAAQAPTFGELLKRSRKRAGMSQDDLAAAIGYSRALIGALERNERMPDVDVVMQTYLPALGLQEEPMLAAQLVELAALARGERPPSSLPPPRRHPQIAPAEDDEVRRMPAPPTGLVGRDKEISDLSNRLLGHHGRLLTLVGPPGVGKTTLALAVGAKLQPFYRDGARFVPLAPVRDPALMASALLSALDLRDSSSKPPRLRLIEHLRRKEMLLVLDNFEQLITVDSPAVELVADLLAECGGLRILITSRERLHLRAEQRYRVPPLQLWAAVELFTERCAAVDSEFALTATNRPLIEAICEQVDRLPLALELSAAQTDLLSPAQLLDRLRDRRLELLVDGAHDLPPQQRTLRTAIEYSYELLNQEERRIFRCLGIFVGGCDLPALAVVSGQNGAASEQALLSTLHALIGKSLVHVETAPGGPGRYVLLETIREFALEQVRATAEEDSLRARHYEAYLQIFRAADAGLRGPESLASNARMDAEQDNLRAALQWALDEQRYVDAAWLILAVAWYWYYTGQWPEGGRWIARLLPHREALDDPLRLAFLLSLYSISPGTEEFQPRERFDDELAKLSELCSDKLLGSTAWFQIAAGGAGLAEVTWERAIALARGAREDPEPDPRFGWLHESDFVLAVHLERYADRLIEHGEFVRAEPLLLESTQLFQARGSNTEMATILGSRGRLALFRGDMAKARGFLQEAVQLARTLNYLEVLGWLEPLLGFVILYDGGGPAARHLLMTTLRLCLDLQDKVYVARVCAFLAATALCDGNLGQAEQWLAQSIAYDPIPRYPSLGELERIHVAARLATAREDYVLAARLFGAAERVRRELRYVLVEPVQQLIGEAMTRGRAALGSERFEPLFSAVLELSLDDAFAAVSTSYSHSGIMKGGSALLEMIEDAGHEARSDPAY